MPTFGYYIIYGFLAIMVLVGIYLMSKIKTATIGNLISALAVALGIIVTLIQEKLLPDYIIWIALVLGLLVGLFIAKKVKMIEMPEFVAILNGVGGLASAIVAIFAFVLSGDTFFASFTALIALMIGVITFFGSLVAAGKLHKILPSKAIKFKGHSAYSLCALLASVAIVFVGSLVGMPLWIAPLIVCLLSTAFGILFSIRVGGPDMPITISLLNSLSGVAGAIAGMAIQNYLLIAVGGIVGASGLLLTQIMCKAMNRSILAILIPGFKKSTKKDKNTAAITEISEANNIAAENASGENIGEKENVAMEETVVEIVKTPKEIIADAKNVIIVPGYGMALSQAQSLVKELCDKLQAAGKTVKFAIHPVAGRMPGHMNVLLCEVDIPYEMLYELETINVEFKTTDLTIVIGANDVINPAANTMKDTPIYGMPILNVMDCKNIFILNYDLKPGYAGVDNPIYSRVKGVHLLLGDAKESLKKLL